MRSHFKATWRCRVPLRGAAGLTFVGEALDQRRAECAGCARAAGPGFARPFARRREARRLIPKRHVAAAPLKEGAQRGELIRRNSGPIQLDGMPDVVQALGRGLGVAVAKLGFVQRELHVCRGAWRRPIGGVKIANGMPYLLARALPGRI